MVTVPAEMVGRAAPLAELLALHAEASRGRGRAALILGEAGMGKSTLVEALADHVGDRSVAWGWASLDAAPYAAWRTALDALLPDHPLRERAPVAGEDGGAARHLMFAAVRRSLANAATERGMLLLVLEDLHWADPPSLALLHSLVEGLRGSRSWWW